MNFCIKCGSELMKGALFCGNCGYKIPDEKLNQQDSDISASSEVNESETVSVNETLLQDDDSVMDHMPDIEETTEKEEPEVYSFDEGSADFEVESNPETEEITNTPKNLRHGKKLLFALIGIAVAFIMITGAFLGLIISNDQISPKRTAQKYVHSVIDGDSDEIIELMYPKKVLRAILKKQNMSFDTFEEIYEDRYDLIERSYSRDYGKNLRGKVRITDKVKLSKEDISYKEIQIKRDTNADINITDACMIECEITIMGSKGQRTTVDSLTLYKIGRKWYILREA